MQNPVKIVETATSHVFRVHYHGVLAILKLLKPQGRKWEGMSANYLQCFDSRGAVKVVCADKNALLLEFLEGEKLSMMVHNNRDTEAAKIICHVLDLLHSYSGPIPSSCHDLKRHCRSLFTRAEQMDAEKIYRKASLIARELIATERNKVLLHGDIHHCNIIKSCSRNCWIAIDPQSFFAERTYDVANSFFNPDDQPELVESSDRVQMLAAIYAEHLGVSESRVLKFAYVHGVLSSSWQLDVGQLPQRRMRINKIIESLL